MPTPRRQNHRCLDERTRYYSFRYSTICYKTSGFLCARYNISPVNLQSHYDICGTVLVVTNSLIFRIGGLVIARKNEIHEKLLYLFRNSFISAYVRAEPLIHQGSTRSELEIRQVSGKHKDMRGGRDDPRFMGLSSWFHYWRQT